MFAGRTFVAVVPARGGSKGIPRKNLAPLLGRPLIGHTLDAAAASAYLDAVVVSTDDDAIAEVSAGYGAHVVRRPAELASDTARTIDAVLHAVASLEVAPDNVVLLQPTSPLRTARDIDGAIEQFAAHGGESLASVSPVRQHPLFMRTMSPDGALARLLDEDSTRRRQDLPEVLIVNGAIYIAAVTGLTRETSLNDSRQGFVMSPLAGLDVDEPDDLLVVEALARSRQEETR
ncbi:acylneuraminate cytidylyltransferase family protein [Nocardioides lacus]|uniref:acylneuraminate cytidylyltransferase family protein n=1 Tax=Nocardioides sp. BP30 TaxID=3036374 RepID=UPI0032AF8D29